MGDEQGKSGVALPVIFLDENHCRNPHILAAIGESNLLCEKLLDHFEPGSADTSWLPIIGERGWALLTADARMRTNILEKQAIRIHKVRMFYFSRNDLAGFEMGVALRRALPVMEHLIQTQPPPFTASLNKKGDVTLRDIFLP